MKLLTLCLLSVGSILNVAVAATLHIAVVTAAEFENPNRGRSFAGIQTRPERSVQRAVELALFESSTSFNAFGIDAQLEVIDVNKDRPLKDQIEQIHPEALVLVDTPKAEFIELAQLLHELNRVTVNVRHSDTSLRDQLCLPTLFHTIPSDRMYFDALSQFLIYRGWRKVLIVHGPAESDKQRTGILKQSLEKFGADISEIREFTLSHHPDDRDKNKPEFLTGGASYDVVAVIDGAFDFGRYIQYSTRRARPVVGDVGLMPKGWHRTLERYGAPQLNERFQTFDPAQPLSSTDALSDAEFAAWSAGKLLSTTLNAIDPDAEVIQPREILSHPEAQVDLYKGTRGSIRTWNHQLRQPILLTSGDAVIAVAPMPKFLHPKHYVDTLGLDEPESPCRLD